MDKRTCPKKYCSKCESVKSTRDFYRNTERVDNRYGYCKPCFNAYNEPIRRARQLRDGLLSRYKGAQVTLKEKAGKYTYIINVMVQK